MKTLSPSLKAFLFFVSLVAAFPTSVAAQMVPVEPVVSERPLALGSLNYVVSIPTGNLADFVGNTVSFRGLGVEWQSTLGSSELYWGLSFRWLYFREVQDSGTVTVDTTTATGRLYRAVDSFPMAFHLKYPVAKMERVFPYIGIGVGTIYGMRELQIGTISQNRYGWQFLLAPEVGAVFQFAGDKSLKAVFNVRYDGGFGSDAIPAISNVSFALGLGSSL